MLGETAGKSKALVQGSTKRFTALLSAAMRMKSGSASPEAAPSRTGVFAGEVTEVSPTAAASQLDNHICLDRKLERANDRSVELAALR